MILHQELSLQPINFVDSAGWRSVGIASTLTVRERVTHFNQEHSLIARPRPPPWGKHYYSGRWGMIDLKFVRNKNDLQLVVGWIVERHLDDGDVVLFNNSRRA